jgi:hypothetical protein
MKRRPTWQRASATTEMSRAEKFQNKRKRGTDWTTGEVHMHSHSISIANLAGASANDPITTFVDRVSQDNHRRYHGEMVVEPPSPLKRARQGLQDPAAASGSNSIPADDLELDADCYEMGFEGDDEGARVHAPRLPRVVKPSVCVLSTPEVRPMTDFFFFFG